MKIKNVVIFVVIITVILCLLSNTYAINNKNENTVVFSQSSEQINKNFKLDIEENENVKKGKFAPGMKAYMQSYIDVSNLDFDVELEISPKEDISECFNVKYMIDGKDYQPGNTVLISNNDERIKKLDIEIEWIKNDMKNCVIPCNMDKLMIPFNIEVKQVIK